MYARIVEVTSSGRTRRGPIHLLSAWSAAFSNGATRRTQCGVETHFAVAERLDEDFDFASLQHFCKRCFPNGRPS